MYFLLETCQNPDILRVIFFADQFLELLAIFLPIGLILMLMIDFAKATVVQKDDKDLRTVKLVVKRIISAIVIFIIPWIVDVIMNILEENNLSISYIECIKNADIDIIEYYQGKVDEQKRLEENSSTNNDGSSGGSSGNSSGSSSGGSSGSSSGGSSGGSPVEGQTYEEAAAKMLDNARGELGHVGGGKYSNGSSDPWCAYFTIWNLKNASVSGVGTIYSIITKEGPISADGIAGATIPVFYNHTNLKFYYSKYYGGNYIPKKGDLIYFWYPNRNGGAYWDKGIRDRSADHVGLVDYYDGTIHTIEGNNGNTVTESEYQLNNDSIMGYGSWYTSN